MSDAILLDCPKCGRKIGIRKTVGTIHVTCPSCRKQWDWPRSRAESKPPKPSKSSKTARAFPSIYHHLKLLCRKIFWQVRFAGIHVALATAAGIAVGVFMGLRLAAHRAPTFLPRSANALAPTHFSATNIAGIPVLGVTTNSLESNVSVPKNFKDIVPDNP